MAAFMASYTKSTDEDIVPRARDLREQDAHRVCPGVKPAHRDLSPMWASLIAMRATFSGLVKESQNFLTLV